MKKNFLISTGGSGGHVIPAMILYQHLSKETNVIISTDKRGLRYLDKDNLPVEVINTPKLNNIVMLPINLFITLFLTIKSYFLLKQKKIEKTFSTGGYMSVPLILAAKFLRIDIYLIEPNHVLGRSNRYFLKSCKKIFCYSDEIKNFPNMHKDKIIKINPLVRENTYNVEKNFENKKKFNILVIGGSQGASFFDKDLKKSIINISKKKTIKIIHQTREKNVFTYRDQSIYGSSEMGRLRPEGTCPMLFFINPDLYNIKNLYLSRSFDLCKFLNKPFQTLRPLKP